MSEIGCRPSEAAHMANDMNENCIENTHKIETEPHNFLLTCPELITKTNRNYTWCLP